LSASSAKNVWGLTVKGKLLDTSHVALRPNYLLHFCDAVQVGISGHREHVLVSSVSDLHTEAGSYITYMAKSCLSISPTDAVL